MPGLLRTCVQASTDQGYIQPCSALRAAQREHLSPNSGSGQRARRLQGSEDPTCRRPGWHGRAPCFPRPRDGCAYVCPSPGCLPGRGPCGQRSASLSGPGCLGSHAITMATQRGIPGDGT